jgi:hypothetical protein
MPVEYGRYYARREGGDGEFHGEPWLVRSKSGTTDQPSRSSRRFDWVFSGTRRARRDCMPDQDDPYYRSAGNEDPRDWDTTEKPPTKDGYGNPLPPKSAVQSVGDYWAPKINNPEDKTTWDKASSGLLYGTAAAVTLPFAAMYDELPWGPLGAFKEGHEQAEYDEARRQSEKEQAEKGEAARQAQEDEGLPPTKENADPEQACTDGGPNYSAADEDYDAGGYSGGDSADESEY